MTPASLPWLLRHELRLWWREISRKPGVIIFSTLAGVLLSGSFCLLWWLVRLQQPELETLELSEAFAWVPLVAWLLLFYLAFVQSMGQSIYALFDRADLDLWLTSPMSSRVIFASRLLGVAIQVFIAFLPWIVPITLFAVLLNWPQLLGIYVSLAGTVLFTASLAMILLLALVQWLGAKRARFAAQIATAALSGILFLSFQLPNLIGQGRDRPSFSVPAFTPNHLWGLEHLIGIPARAMLADPLAMVLTLLAGVGITWLVIELLHPVFVAGSQQSVTQKSQKLQKERRFIGGSLGQTVLIKEWRILARNPYLISASFLQILFLVPAVLVVLRGDRAGMSINLLTTTTLLSLIIGQTLTQNLTRLSISAEEAPDLLKAAPVQGSTLRRYKLLAALIPVWLILFPLLVLLSSQGVGWLLSLILCLGATSCAAILRLWNSQPMRSVDIAQRRHDRQGDLLLNILETLSLFCWAGLGYGLMLNQVAAGSLAAIALVIILALSYWRSQHLGTSLGF